MRVYKLNKEVWDAKGKRDVKAVIAGNVVDLYVYENDNIPPVGKAGGRDKVATKKRKEKNRMKVLRMAREKVITLSNSNMSSKTLFVTLTFKENEQNIGYANRELSKFIQRLSTLRNGRGGKQSVPYLGVIEFQERGAIHYHMLLFNLGTISDFTHDGSIEKRHEVNKRMAELWGHGFCKVEQVNAINNVGAYLVKYMLEDMDDARLQGKKSYFHSRDLKQARITYDKKQIATIAEHYTVIRSGAYLTKANGWCTHILLNKVYKPVEKKELTSCADAYSISDNERSKDYERINAESING